MDAHHALAGHRSKLLPAVLGAVMAIALLAAPSALADPAPSDTYQGAQYLSDTNVSWIAPGNISSYTSAGESYAPDGTGGTCSASNSVQIRNTFWFKIRGTGGPITLSTKDVDDASPVDTVILLYPANQVPTGLVGAQACNDDFPGLGRRSQLTFNSAPGATYYAQFGRCATDAACGTADGRVSYTALTNDEPANAEAAPTSTRSNVGAGTSANERTTCGAAQYGATVWFRWTAPAQGHVSFVVSGRRDNVLALYSAAGAFLDCNDDSGGVFRSEVVRDVRAGEQLLIQMGGMAISGGGFNQDNFSYAVSFAPDLDIDKDGYSVTPGPDCNDANAAIHPGATDIANDGVDQDCANGDNVDGDGDGHGRKPGGDDCNDANPGVHPGAHEITGNFVDENCDGRKTPGELNPAPTIRFGSVAMVGGRFFGTLTISNAGKGYRVTVTCRGVGCPKAKKRRHQTKTAKKRGAVKFTQFHGRVLRPGAYVDIVITRPGRNLYGKYERFQVRRPTKLRHLTCRLAPNSTTKKSQCEAD
jgi:hypothetical protein